MKRFVLSHTIFSREKTATALLNTLLRMKEDKRQLKRALLTFINAFHMFLHLIPKLKAFKCMTSGKREIFSMPKINMVVHGCLKSSKENK
jgi:hypothetical protein